MFAASLGGWYPVVDEIHDDSIGFEADMTRYYNTVLHLL
jgi:hypothetical protein